MDKEGKLRCRQLEAVSEVLPQAQIDALPPDAVIVQLTHGNASANAEAAAAAAAERQAQGTPQDAEHFMELLITGEVKPYL